MARQIKEIRTKTLAFLSLIIVALIVGIVKLGFFSSGTQEKNLWTPAAKADNTSGCNWPSGESECACSSTACCDCACVGDCGD
jgi:hypothetical protein